MLIPFYKYQGTGNDFIMVDDRDHFFPRSDVRFVSHLCDRRLGIGADGLILIEGCDSADFGMVYYNSDGREGSMCGNGGRCAAAFAHRLGITGGTATFNAVDGLHSAVIGSNEIQLSMRDVSEIREKPQAIYMDTGSPHHIQMVRDLGEYDVRKEGARIRYGIYGEIGANINFVEQQPDHSFYVRTYERGVEDETLSCGTGVTAVAIAMNHIGNTKDTEVIIRTNGGVLRVSFISNGGTYKEVSLIGPAVEVFKGAWAC